ncbi:bifunctional transcriptional activator/DNA repair enzyme AdaA [Saccharibacillus sp. JS10]|uniref:bifunctional transcriptional activator/DNA repair enzyme AdaA n=1 Tax=Saccharibacillus sp. JS10 TaxID=2950552 RepID=UPI0021093E76|nr:Ada metal-binding domain-containing protein [Saccharibacillus sp. JS10]MCQ4088273.1 helix-turn-helix domain-containing protein [Saccharibacillus sp. JS10]
MYNSEAAGLSFEEMWARIIACDARYDGLFFTAVKTTRIYCRPSCRSRKPKKQNVTFYMQLDQAETAGYRPCKRCQPEVQHSPWNTFIEQARSFIVAHYREPLLLQDIADHVKLSAYYLERLFKQETNETPRMFLEKVRVDRAAHLLRCSDKTNLEVCYEAGFQTPSNFYKAFKRHHHCSPGEYRNQGTPIVREALPASRKPLGGML